MPFSTIAVLATIVVAFAAFAVSLAWVQLHVRPLSGIPHPPKARARAKRPF